VRAAGFVKALIRDQQFAHNFAAHDCIRHDPRHVGDRDAPVPGSLRVNYDRRPVLALVEATGVVGANQRTTARFLEFSLEGITQRLFAVGVATTPLVAGFANIPAHKDMNLK
jgi:hypothetical protein